jgi:hypothetical protein
MPDQDPPGGPKLGRQLQTAARTKAVHAVQAIVAEFGARTVLPVRSRSLTWPGINGVEPEPIACLEAARELERAAHALQVDYIRLAREAGRSWSEIGDGLDLHWAASANKESIADEAYDYALRYDPRPGRRTFTWTCPACHQAITDNGPYIDPPGQEHGHADSCPRWSARLARWQQHRADL